jgi:hypothetical protein
MASIFEELEALDRPFLPVKITIGKMEREFLARVPSAEESDALDAAFIEEYAKILAEKSQPQEGKTSEMATVRAIYKGRPKSDIVEQLVGSRQTDIMREALTNSGLDMGAETVKMFRMPLEEKTKYAEDLDAQLEVAKKPIVERITAEYDALPIETLLDQLSQVNINIKSLALANRNTGADYIYQTLYEFGDQPKRVYPSPEKVRNLKPDTIEKIVKAIRAVVEISDVPLDLPDEKEQDKPSSSPSNLEAETKPSGDSTPETPAS